MTMQKQIDNSIEYEGAVKISESLAANTTLTELMLQGCECDVRNLRNQ